MNYNFKCKRCGNNTIEEILTDVTVSSVITAIHLIDNGDGDEDYIDFEMEYGDTENNGGDVSRYQCCECGKVISKKDMLTMLKGDI